MSVGAGSGAGSEPAPPSERTPCPPPEQTSEQASSVTPELSEVSSEGKPASGEYTNSLGRG